MDPVQKPAVAGILMINSIRNVSPDRDDLEKKTYQIEALLPPNGEAEGLFAKTICGFSTGPG